MRKSQVLAGDASALMNPLTYISVNLGLVAVLYAGGIEVNIGNFTQGELVALVNYASQLLVELLKFANLINSLSKAEACSKRVNEIFAHKPTMVDGTKSADDIEPTVSFEDVSFTYPKASAPALEHITFSVGAGDIVGIIGSTGSGKSTIASLLMRFYDATSGTIKVGGSPIDSYSLKSLHHVVGIVDQKPHLFAGTVKTNLLLANEQASDNQLKDAITNAQASNVVEAKGGLDGTIEQLGRNLSGGQRQRMSIARTLVRAPKILILDDASSALDLATDAALRHALSQMRNTTQVVISQRVSAIRHATKILVLDEGKLVGIGTHEDLFKSCEVYQEICESQLEAEEVCA